MPAQFAQDPPWWLLLVGPEQFRRALEQVEEETERRPHNAQRLSSLMRESWESGDFWFNFAARRSLDVDAIFYTQLDRLNFGGSAGVDLLDDGVRAGMESLVELKMKQKEAYDKQVVLLYG